MEELAAIFGTPSSGPTCAPSGRRRTSCASPGHRQRTFDYFVEEVFDTDETVPLRPAICS